MPAVAHIIRRRHSRKRRRRHESRRSAFWLTLILFFPALLLLTPAIAGLGLSIWLYIQAASHLPTPQESVFLDPVYGVTRYYDRGGATEIHRTRDPLGDERPWRQLDQLPKYVIDAALLVEEPTFLTAPPSFDLLDAALQTWRYIIGLPLAPNDDLTGALVREAMLPLTRRSGLDPRLLEIVLIAESKRSRSAGELLEWRLNSRFYGHDAYGIDAAAKVYFGKNAAQLDLAEAAILAKTAEEPALNPIDAQQRSRERGADLLFDMLAAEMIDEAQFDAASASAPPVLAPASKESSLASEFVDYARVQAAAILTRLGQDGESLVARGGLRIITSLDLDLQYQAECALESHLGHLSGDGTDPGGGCDASSDLKLPSLSLASPPNQGALVLIDVGSGEILSLVGAAAAPRHQPATVLHPFVYMHAFLQRELTPASMVYDIPRAYPGRSAELIYTPANPDGRHRGPLNLRDAMAADLLPPVAQVASAAGMPAVINTAQAMGFSSLEASDVDLALLERGGSVSVLDTAYAYSVLASLGAMRGLPIESPGAGYRGRDPVAVLEIADAAGVVLWAYAGEEARQTQIIEPSLAYLVNDILADGEARQTTLQEPDLALQLARPAAVLDGLSGDKRDSWTVGYTPQLAIVVRVGRDDEADMSINAAQRLASAPVWQSLMTYAHQQRALPPRAWQAPDDVEEYLVCELSGLLPGTTDHCPTRRELMPAGSNLRRDDMWQTVEINRATGQLATVNTPDDLREEVAYFLPPEAILDWWVENDKPLPPTSYSADGAAPASKAVQISAPADYAYVGSTVDIRATINRAGAESWFLEYGADVNPKSWQAIGERRRPAPGGAISATWETALLSGIHTLRLTVIFTDGSRETDTRLLTFDNTPPAIQLQKSDGSPPAGQTVSLLAAVSDNLTIERVEFYRDDELLGVDVEWPYGIEVDIGSAGDAAVRAVAYDQVGNRAESRLVISRDEAG